MAKKEKKEKDTAAENQPEKKEKEKKGKEGKAEKPGKVEKVVVKKSGKIKLPEDGAATAFTVLLVLVGIVDLILALYIVARMLFPGLVNQVFKFAVGPTTGWVETVPTPDVEGELPITYEPLAAEEDAL